MSAWPGLSVSPYERGIGLHLPSPDSSLLPQPVNNSEMELVVPPPLESCDWTRHRRVPLPRTLPAPGPRTAERLIPVVQTQASNLFPYRSPCK